MKLIFFFLMINVMGFSQEPVGNSIQDSYIGKSISTFEKSKIYNDLKIDSSSLGFYKIGSYNMIAYYKDSQLVARITFEKPFKNIKGNIIFKKNRGRIQVINAPSELNKI